MRFKLPDILFLSLTSLFGILAIIGAGTLPPPFYDPLGAGAFPRALGILLLGLTGLRVLFLIIASLAQTNEDPTGDQVRFYPRVAVMFGLMLGYLGLLSWQIVDFWFATTLFLASGTMSLIGTITLRNIVVVAGCSLGMAIALQLFFRHFFFLNI